MARDSATGTVDRRESRRGGSANGTIERDVTMSSMGADDDARAAHARIPAPVRRALDELSEALAEEYGERLRGLCLYGSYARGDFRDDSDVDLIVILNEDISPVQESRRLSPLVSDICLRHDVLMALFPMSEERFRTRHTPLMENVRREGIFL